MTQLFSTVPGFRFSAVPAQIRKDGRIDVALAVCDRPATVAAVFTRNLVRAAPVLVAAERVRAGSARAILANSGCANACTGRAGERATLESTAAVARALGVAPEMVLPASTGVIGAVLPSQRIASSARALVDALSPEGHPDFAQAICTTDRWTKVAWAALGEGAQAPRVLAMGKGAGMIHPDVGLLEEGGSAPHATMLVFLFTDARVERDALESALVHATERTFNECSVDGDTSTNDTVFAMASGASGVLVPAAALARACESVCDALARSMVADGEGSEHCVELFVRGLGSDQDARAVARTVATSMLVKTALCGRDANWGRILGAAGRAGVSFDPSKARISIGGVPIVEQGLGVGGDAEQAAAEHMKSPTYTIELELGSGPGTARYLMSDLGHGYVDVNASYRS
ncbi:MAG: bifunctional glutamate N-acetyltransferase/amino-acid acetyltransferase ArgJ [Polyangiaceae bacterium]|nr:bifunctional glutamate N-acetyltransferase/amino-acid acetyltransferase ArgJ [Polyangiaceae bacterium]